MIFLVSRNQYLQSAIYFLLYFEIQILIQLNKLRNKIFFTVFKLKSNVYYSMYVIVSILCKLIFTIFLQ